MLEYMGGLILVDCENVDKELKLRRHNFSKYIFNEEFFKVLINIYSKCYWTNLEKLKI